MTVYHTEVFAGVRGDQHEVTVRRELQSIGSGHIRRKGCYNFFRSEVDDGDGPVFIAYPGFPFIRRNSEALSGFAYRDQSMFPTGSGVGGGKRRGSGNYHRLHFCAIKDAHGGRPGIRGHDLAAIVRDPYEMGLVLPGAENGLYVASRRIQGSQRLRSFGGEPERTAVKE